MKNHSITSMLVLSSIFILSGCVVRSYSVTKDRVDQDLNTGNRGYLAGERSGVDRERAATRTYQAVEVELHSPIKFERMPKTTTQGAGEIGESQKTEEEGAWGNRGYITRSYSPEESTAATEKYTVKKGDTLQKISKRLYGTTKNWMKIYEANKGVLKAPNKIYPGQVIYVPVEQVELKETKENLK